MLADPAPSRPSDEAATGIFCEDLHNVEFVGVPGNVLCMQESDIFRNNQTVLNAARRRYSYIYLS